jgi:UDP-glucose 4-epimerase
MNVLVTGAYGFLGRYVAKEYKSAGHHVVGMGHGKWYKEEFNNWGIDQWYETTITFEALLNINKEFDLIVHCGGGGSVAFSQENPYEDFQKTVQSTLSLLEFIRLRNPNCKFIYPSSPAVQGNLGKVAIKEEMVSMPVSPYGFHKKIAEELCYSFHKNFNISIGVIRYFSIYGEGLKKQLLWDACRKLQNTDDIVFFGTGMETRDWIYISDATALMRTFSDQLEGFQVINGGSGKNIEIKYVIDKLYEHFNTSKKISFNGHTKEGDPLHFWADMSKARALGWEPKVDIEQGLKKYVNYFQNIHNG